jgi:hypothetical protein
MSRMRLLILLLTFFVVGTVATLISLYARGFRFNSQKQNIQSNGLLVMKSSPDGAQIVINGAVKTATNATIPLPPGTYDISVKKEGFRDWQKRMQIQKEIVTEGTAHLFKSVPSLTAATFSSVTQTTPSNDFTKLAYIVPASSANAETQGLWIMETLNLPLGFARDPIQVTDGNLENSSFIWSPSGREILLTTERGVFLLETGNFTPQSRWVNVSAQKEAILLVWEEEKEKLLLAQSRKLPNEMKDVLLRRASSVIFSPDEDMVLYTASSSADIANDLIKQLPGASTQKQERTIKPGSTYIYDVKEDRNFLIDDHSEDLQLEGGYSDGMKRRISWYPTSRHVVLAEAEQVIIMDYDGTNRQNVFTGSYVAPNAFPTLSMDRILILTNLGANSQPPNLYSVGIK